MYDSLRSMMLAIIIMGSSMCAAGEQLASIEQLMAMHDGARQEIRSYEYEIELRETTYDGLGNVQQILEESGAVTAAGGRIHAQYIRNSEVGSGQSSNTSEVIMHPDKCVTVYNNIAVYVDPIQPRDSLTDRNNGFTIYNDVGTCLRKTLDIWTYAYGLSAEMPETSVYLLEAVAGADKKIIDDGEIVTVNVKPVATFVFEKDRGFMNTLLEVWAGDVVVTEKLITPAQDAESGIWYPESIVFRRYSPRGDGSRTLRGEVLIDVRNFRANHDVDESLFEIGAEYAPDPQATHLIQDNLSVDTETTRTQTSSPSTTSNSSSFSVASLLIGSGFCLVIAGIVLSVRKRYSTQSHSRRK